MRVALALLCSFGLPAVAAAALPSQLMLELTLHGHKIEGTPVRWSSAQVLLLGRDGRLWHFSPDEASDFHRTSDHFHAISVSGIRAMLLRELGSGYEVSGTGHYLVAHPQGQRDVWAPRFEDLYRSFFHYFTVRGFRPHEPEFPLIGVVAASRAEFESCSAREGTSVGGGVLGYYSPQTNRILLYDVGDGRASAADWRNNASTTIHEATHQTAFNTGIHSRYAPPPKWVAEGLATMFEAPGVYDSQAYPELRQRINRGRYQNFIRSVAPQHRPELLLDIVTSDKIFLSAPAQAYAEAWALTFYLVETRPAKYFDYLARTADPAAFSHDTPAQRLADFKVAFGSDVRMLEAQFLRFMRDSSLAL
jgi:hypothetical protein